VTDLHAILRDLEALRSRIEAAPLEHIRWTPPQNTWLTSPAPRKLLRAGNQLGKTWSAMAEVIYRATGTHPHYATHKPPVEIWVVCTSWSQSVAIMRKFWDLVPRDVIRPTRFDPRNGFGKDNPAVVFLNGSVVRFRTTNQGPEALAGATIHYVAVDEPCDEDIYRELDRRVLRNAGSIGITLTPINRPCGWLRELVEAGSIEEVHATLTVDNLTPTGASGPLRLLDGTPMDQDWIDLQRRLTPPSYAPVVLDGEWETRPFGVFFSCFDRARHINGAVRLDPARGAIKWVLGIDYAAADRQYGQVGVLSQVQSYADDKGRRQELIYVVDHAAMPGVASSEQFASEVASMLTRNGLRWRELASVYGDNPIATRWVEKSNLNTSRAMARELSIPLSALTPRILSAKDGSPSAGAMDTGCRYIYEGLAAGRIILHPRCEVLATGFEQWDYTRDHPLKDILDAFRYSLKDFIFRYGSGHSGTVVRFR
jgi:phage terminase large subunit-like protein